MAYQSARIVQPQQQNSQPTGQPQMASTNPMSNLQSLFGGEITPLQLLIGSGLLKQGKLSQAYTVFKPQKETAQQQKLKIQKLQGQKLSRQLEGMLGSWEKVPLLQRLPIPFSGRVSPQRAKYEVAKNLYTQMLITMVADKRITDQERQFYLKQFPDLLTSKEVAKTKVEAIRGFVEDFNNLEPPDTAPNINDLLMLTQQE